MKIDCTVIDAGARYGLHPTWEKLKDIVNFELFEIDPVEYGRLKSKYARFKNIDVHEIGLHSHKKEATCTVFQHKALSSLYDINVNNISNINHKVDEFGIDSKIEVKLDTIDNLFSNKEIHFLKLDVEGNELSILKGTHKKLASTVLAIRAEVSFREIFKGAPLFGQLNAYLIEREFELLNLDYTGKGVACSQYTNPNQYGYLVTTDAVWVLSLEKLFQRFSNNALKKNIIRLAVFLFENNATDVAIHLLKKAKEKGICFSNYKDDQLYCYLERKILFLFKDLGYQPGFDKNTLNKCFYNLLGYEFPDVHRFYEKIDSLSAD